MSRPEQPAAGMGSACLLEGLHLGGEEKAGASVEL